MRMHIFRYGWVDENSKNKKIVENYFYFQR